jgi:hypothetical protein
MIAAFAGPGGGAMEFSVTMGLPAVNELVRSLRLVEVGLQTVLRLTALFDTALGQPRASVLTRPVRRRG